MSSSINYELKIKENIEKKNIDGLIRLSRKKDVDIKVNIQAIRALGHINDDNSIKHLKSLIMLENPNDLIIIESVESLKNLGLEPNALELYYYLLAIGDSEKVIIGELLESFIELALKSEDPNTRSRILGILGQIQGAKSTLGIQNIWLKEVIGVEDYRDSIRDNAQEILINRGFSKEYLDRMDVEYQYQYTLLEKQDLKEEYKNTLEGKGELEEDVFKICLKQFEDYEETLRNIIEECTWNKEVIERFENEGKYFIDNFIEFESSEKLKYNEALLQKHDKLLIKIDELKEKNLFFYIENFVAKFRDNYGSNEIKKLKDLLSYKGFDITEDELKKIIRYLLSVKVYSDFKAIITQNDPKNLKEYVINFTDAYGEKYESHMDLFIKLLSEKGININLELFESTLSKIKREKESLTFEEFLMSDSSESPFITINDVDKLNGYEFENLLKVLLEKKGYNVENTPLSGDQGADLVISRFGEKIVVQAKCYNGSVGNKAVQEVVASIAYYGANKGMVITNSDFTSSAYDLAKINNIKLIDREQLEKMIKYYLISKEEIK